MTFIVSFLCAIAISGAFYRLGMMEGKKKGMEQLVAKIAENLPYRTMVVDQKTGKNILHMLHDKPISLMSENDFCALVAELALMWHEPANVVKRNFPNIKEVKK